MRGPNDINLELFWDDGTVADTGFTGGTKGAEVWDPGPDRLRAAGSMSG